MAGGGGFTGGGGLAARGGFVAAGGFVVAGEAPGGGFEGALTPHATTLRCPPKAWRFGKTAPQSSQVYMITQCTTGLYATQCKKSRWQEGKNCTQGVYFLKKFLKKFSPRGCRLAVIRRLN